MLLSRILELCALVEIEIFVDVETPLFFTSQLSFIPINNEVLIR